MSMRIPGLPILLVLLAGFALAAVAEAQPQPTVYGYRIVDRFPHDPAAYTQGLRFHDGYMFEGTGRNGQSVLKKYPLDSGDVVLSQRLADRYFGEGIEIVGDSIFQLTWQSHVVFVYDLATFEQKTTFFNPTEGWGLAYDGAELILSDGTENLYFLDPATFVSGRKVRVTLNGDPVRNLNELEFIEGEVWANIWQTDFIVRIDPASGTVNSIVDLTGLGDQTRRTGTDAVLNGIAWDGDARRLFVTGKLWSDIFEIELVGPD